jgi:ATP-dependent RNA helicase DeaD
MLRDARVPVEWSNPPTVAEIAAADRTRLIATLAEPIELDDEDKALGAELLTQRPAEEVAAMLVRAHRAKLPAPEELIEGGPRSPGQSDRMDGPRPGFEDTVWFRVNIGRRHNADPRWLLPLLCRRGHVARQEVGAIRIGTDETQFQIPRAVAGRFAAALRRTAGQDQDGEVAIEPVPGGGPPPQQQQHRAPARHHARPTHANAGPRGRR